jgi:hypothetical protein
MKKMVCTLSVYAHSERILYEYVIKCGEQVGQYRATKNLRMRWHRMFADASMRWRESHPVRSRLTSVASHGMGIAPLNESAPL